MAKKPERYYLDLGLITFSFRNLHESFTTQKMKLRKLRIWSHLLKKSLMENFIFCAVFNKNSLMRYISAKIVTAADSFRLEVSWTALYFKDYKLCFLCFLFR